MNGASLYSNACSTVNRIPRITVISNDVFLLLISLFRIEWWHHVTDTPDDRRMIVFRSGMFIGLNGRIAAGGHVCPISTFGEILLWKNAQKNEKKNRTSDVMNKIIPICSPFVTIGRWFPCAAVSEETFVHHMALMISMVNKAN